MMQETPGYQNLLVQYRRLRDFALEHDGAVLDKAVLEGDMGLTDQAANTEALRALGAGSWADPPEATQSAVGGGPPLVALTDEQILKTLTQVRQEFGNQLLGAEELATIAMRVADAQLAKDQAAIGPMVAAAKAIMNEMPICECDKAYTSRNLGDPSCIYHSIIGAEEIEGLKAALSQV